MDAPHFSFLSKVPDQKGYLVLQDGAVIKSEGDLANRESMAQPIERMLAAQLDLQPSVKFQNMNIIFSDYFLSVSRSGKYIFVLKRALPLE